MGPPPAVSVVVSTRDRAARLARLLDSLRGQTVGCERFEVVVVDDGSSDGTGAVLGRVVGDGGLALTPIRRSASGGPAKGRNAGWRATRAPLVAFIDDDCEADARWLEAGLRACAQQPGALVQGRTAPNPAELDRLGPFSRTLEIDGPSPWFQTCNIFYPRALLERLGGFDESFPVPGGEDTDLGWRALELGVASAFAPEALVHHAVEDLGPRGHLRVALRWADAMGMFRHAGLRRSALIGGVFWKPTHALLCAALLGLVLAPRAHPALGLGLPYLRHLRGRTRRVDVPLVFGAYFALHDLLEVYAALRGAARHGLVVI